MRLARRAVHRVHQPTTGDPQAEAIVQQRRDFAVGQAIPFIEQDREGDRLRPQLYRSSAERIRGLQRMPPLHAPTAVQALPDVDVKASDERRLDRQFFLVLPRHADAAHASLTVWACRGQRRRVDVVDVRRQRPMTASSIRHAAFAARSTGVRDARIAREGGRLPIDGAARRLELVLQFLVLAAEPLAFRLRPTQVLAQPLDLAALLVDDLLRVGRRRRLVAVRHTVVMPNPRSKYKREMRVSAH